MKLFDVRPSIKGSRKAAHTRSEYLAGSVRPEIGAARNHLESAFALYPEDKKEGLKAKIISKDDILCSSAIFELQFFLILTNMGAAPIEVEPVYDGVVGTPDFCVHFGDQSFVVELAEVRRLSNREEGLEKIRMQIIDFMRSVEATRVGVICGRVKIENGLSGFKIFKKQFSRWIAALEANPTIENKRFTHDGFSVACRSLVRDTGDLSSVLLGWSGGANWSSTPEQIRKKIKEKASKYRKLPHRYIVALNIHDFTFDDEDAISAMFGSLSVSLTFDEARDQLVEKELFRASDGQILSQGKLQHTTSAGFFLIQALNELALDRASIFFPHPEEQTDLQPWTRFKTTRLINDSLETTPAEVRLLDLLN
jgi:hypothetical protein